jgi:hypothetical protein
LFLRLKVVSLLVSLLLTGKRKLDGTTAIAWCKRIADPSVQEATVRISNISNISKWSSAASLDQLHCLYPRRLILFKESVDPLKLFVLRSPPVLIQDFLSCLDILDGVEHLLLAVLFKGLGDVGVVAVVEKPSRWVVLDEGIGGLVVVAVLHDIWDGGGVAGLHLFKFLFWNGGYLLLGIAFHGDVVLLGLHGWNHLPRRDEL